MRQSGDGVVVEKKANETSSNGGEEGSTGVGTVALRRDIYLLNFKLTYLIWFPKREAKFLEIQP